MTNPTNAQRARRRPSEDDPPGAPRLGIELDARNPYRPPDWRWQAAQLLANRNGPVTSVPDSRVRLAVDFLRRVRRGDSCDEWLRLCHHAQFRDLFWLVFWKFHQSDPVRRQQFAGTFADLEAYILAGATRKQIQQRFSFGGKKQQLYETLFFDVRSRRDRRDFILHHVIGCPARSTPQDDRQRERKIVLVLGYFGGVAVLDLLLTPPPGLDDGPELQAARQFLAAVLKNVWQARALLASHGAGVRELSPDAVLRTLLRLEQRERGPSEPAASNSDMIQAIERVSSYFRERLHVVDTGQAACEESMIELRVEEQLALDEGKLSLADLNLKEQEEAIRRQCGW